ncbi:MAG: hypothetical protein EA391_02120 [Balneolaceae bacterium]|nr:MAG: hypothetical protein EA391_02120 [Balneolaceae bacterium]
MDIFKLIFEHDLRLDQLRDRHLDRENQEVSLSIEDFMKPDPTYSKFYITGTVLDQQKFGLNCLSNFDSIIDTLSEALKEYNLFYGDRKMSLQHVLQSAEIGDAILLSKGEKIKWDAGSLKIDSESNIGHKKTELAEVLEAGDLVLYKEHAHQGFDLHLFSQENIYPEMFYPLQKLVDPEFRFFSINGKRIRSEKHFYFETWTLHRPPHGAEEVFPETIL